MRGDSGPYMDPDGPDVWVPRIVPYLEARRIARQGYYEDGNRLVYVGKSDAALLGFSRDCHCEEVCEMAVRCATCDHDHEDLADGCWSEGCACVTFDPANEGVCRVPAWHFRVEER